mmetsp:Transcript_2771/g.8164  ORF Transcript_2771/g.8164 Transcript_2771/m.8164 type:complete len:307 (-) Transcript_2771:1317-2237(-)
MRCAREMACWWTCGLNQRSRKSTWFALAMLRPVPPEWTVINSAGAAPPRKSSRTLDRSRAGTSPSNRRDATPSSASAPSTRSNALLKNEKTMICSPAVATFLIASSAESSLDVETKPPLMCAQYVRPEPTAARRRRSSHRGHSQFGFAASARARHFSRILWPEPGPMSVQWQSGTSTSGPFGSSSSTESSSESGGGGADAAPLPFFLVVFFFLGASSASSSSPSLLSSRQRWTPGPATPAGAIVFFFLPPPSTPPRARSRSRSSAALERFGAHTTHLSFGQAQTFLSLRLGAKWCVSSRPLYGHTL